MTNYIEKLHNVSPEIIKKGEEYYKEGRIKDFHKENDKYFASIEGNAKYSVSLTIKNKEMISFNCSCPYPHLCKHVVALLAKIQAEEKEENTFETLKRKISSVSFSENLEEFKGLPYKINGFLSFLNKNEYMSLISLYLGNMANHEKLFNDGNIAERFKIFNEKGKFDSKDIKEIISKTLEFLRNSPNNLDSSCNFISSFLRDELTSKEIQDYIVEQYELNDITIKHCLTCLNGKSLPKYLLPSFTYLLSKTSPRLLSIENITIAKEEFKKNGSNDEILSLLRLLLNKGDPSLIDDSDFEYLVKNGLTTDARNIAFALMKSSDNFSDYLRFRRLYTDKEFFGNRYTISRTISYKSYLNSILLFDGQRFFPELYPSFSYDSLNPMDVYMAKDFIKERKDIHVLTEIAHKYIKGELAKKNRNKDYFYYLLYLDYLKDDSLSYYLFTEEVLIDKDSKDLKGVWLYLLERNGLLNRANIFSYGEEKACL